MYIEKVLEVHHYSDRLFKFKTTRNRGFRFKNGEFAMIGLPGENEQKPIFRAYSVVSTCYDDHLEFLSIKVPDGPLTSKLQHIRLNDEILVKPKTTGSLCIDYLKQTDNLVLLSTGTGLAPFMSIVRDFETYDKYKKVFLFHTVRNKNELAFRDTLISMQQDVPLTYVETVTREPYVREGRFWNHIDKYLPGGLTLGRDSVMVCGSPDLNKQCRTQFTEQSWQEGNTGELGDFMLERAFVD
jgi:ferredoxin--NADP+ reductase